MKAIILAGGKGKRLRPYTDDRPKGMVEVLGMPILEYQVRWLHANGIDGVLFSCGYRNDVIREYFGDGSKWGVTVAYAVEETPLGRGGGIKYALSHLAPADDPVVVTNGDVITNFPLSAMIAEHRSSGLMATIYLAPYFSPFGIVDVDEDGAVLGFREKPELPYWINGGVYVLNRAISDYLPDQGDHEIETFPHLVEQGQLGAYRSRAYWQPVDTVKDLSVTSQDLGQFMLERFFDEATEIERVAR
ncbi:MAG: nucleotidyltransferase family protein [Chloroflexia bacterium]|nr:nucleotidyltransferase family protein [Chloroflexia bacterium]